MTQIPSTFGLSPEQVENLLETAGRAPSLHNTQPWRFHLTPTAIELHADPGRALPVVDPEDRELRIACGAALFNLRMALHGHRIRPLVTLLPDPSRPHLLAVVRHGGTKIATPEQEQLLRAVPLRRTNRHPFTDNPVSVPEQHALRRAAQDEKGRLHIVDDPQQRAAMQEMALRAHRLQIEDPTFRAEARQWTGGAPDRSDGVPAWAAGPVPASHDRWVLRDFRGGAGPERVPGKDFEEQPLIAVLTAHLSGAAAEIQAGQALQRVLLAATTHGLAVSFLSHIVEVPQTRNELSRLIDDTRPPQAVLRIGRGWPVGATPRRAVTDLLTPEPTTA